jgi:large subunit ribosomal protein L10
MVHTGCGSNLSQLPSRALGWQALTVVPRPNRAGGSNWQWSLGTSLGANLWRLALERAEKSAVIASLQEALAGAGSIVVAHNTGLTVAAFTDLRVQVKKAGGKVKVAKNRLAKLALKETDVADISGLFTGPTVIAYAEDPVAAPKIAAAFAEKNQKFVILGGAMGSTALDANGVKALATMPSLDELRAKLAGLVKQPAQNIASILVQPGAGIARVLKAHAEKSEAA